MITAVETHRDESVGQKFIHKLSNRYVIVLVVVANLLIVDQAVIQPLLKQATAIAPSINIAGRQRMISQRLTKNMLAISSGHDKRDRFLQGSELRNVLEQWMEEHEALKVKYHVPDLNNSLYAQWSRMDPHYQTMVNATHDVLKQIRTGPKMPPEGVPSEAKYQEAIAAAAGVMLKQEASFLPLMDEIVHLLEQHADRSIERLQMIDMTIAVLIVGCIVLLGWLVVRPATTKIREQILDLEARVQERTYELGATLSTLRDEVTQRHDAELRSQRLSTQLMHADRVMTMSHLTVGIAHELKQPLAAIANYAETCDILIEQRPPEDQGRAADMTQAHTLLSMAKSAAHRAGHILRRMTNYVRPQEGDTTETDLHALVNEISDLLRPELAASSTILHLELAPETPTIYADAIQIQQVLINLLQNSLQAMRDARTAYPHITIRTSMDVSESESQVNLSVLDNGPGFSKAQLEDMFSPFETTKADGLGIGLAICRSIIENHHGTIWIETLAHGGAAIHLTLPTLRPDAHSDATATDCLCCR